MDKIKEKREVILMKKILFITLVMTILIYFMSSAFIINQSYAQSREPQTSKLDKYPGYTELIEKLKKSHPNWNFTILYTGLDWSQVIKNETVAYHGRNLVESNQGSSWICSQCGDKPYDGRWRCASEQAVAYYMDPRNSLNEDYVFQFENLSYNASIQTREGVEKILQPCNYMQGRISYTDVNGETQIINKTYVDVIMEAAQEYKVSPYHLASRIRLEIGTGDGSVIVHGNYNGYTGYYNYFNIKATGGNVIANGLAYAKKKGWTDPEKAIKGGAQFLASGYITTGQDTLYLQKFDVDDSDNSLYSYQYMQNVSASKTEGNTTKNAYEEMGLLNSSISFVVPVYENMPSRQCSIPGTNNIVTQNVQVKGNNVYIREGKGTNFNSLQTLNAGDKLLRIETASNIENGYYWDKVVLSDGRKGYVARNFIEQIADITNCSEEVIATTGVYLRNGPGTNDTQTILLLVAGQRLTRLNKEEYDVDGYKWDRVKLSDGMQGYVATQYLKLASDAGNNGGNTNRPSESGEEVNEKIEVICPSGLWVRTQAGTDKTRATYLNKGETATRIRKNVSTANGYTWDKIMTNSGVTGYVARGDSSGEFIQVVQENNPNNPNPGGNTENKKGDVSGDGKILANDYVLIKNYIMGTGTLSEKGKAAADVNGDGKILANDYVLIKNYIMGTGTL